MIVDVKYFYENTDADYSDYDSLWSDNRERMIFLHDNVQLRYQKSNIADFVAEGKDILAIRRPSYKYMKRSKIVNDIISGKGFTYSGDNTWYPKEVWIYEPY